MSLSALDATQQGWLADLNGRRILATSTYPISYANLVVDEYAQEQANLWAAIMTARNAAATAISFAPYVANYEATAGSMYNVNLATFQAPPTSTAGSFSTADAAWLAENANCPKDPTLNPVVGNWSTCAFGATTGDYINISNKRDVWVGLGYSHSEATNGYAFGAMIVQNTGATSPASRVRRLK